MTGLLSLLVPAESQGWERWASCEGRRMNEREGVDGMDWSEGNDSGNGDQGANCREAGSGCWSEWGTGVD